MTTPVTPEMYKRVFEQHAEGRLILDALTLQFARPAVVKGGIDAVLETYQRDGQRRVLEFIVAQINRANGVDTNAFEE